MLDAVAISSSSLRRQQKRRCRNCAAATATISASPTAAAAAARPPSPPLFGRETAIGHPLSVVERAVAVTLSRIGETQQHAAQRLACSRQTVSRWKRRYDETGDVQDAKRSGKPRHNAEDNDCTIVMLAFCRPSKQLSDEHKRKRLSFARGYRNWDRAAVGARRLC